MVSVDVKPKADLPKGLQRGAQEILPASAGEMQSQPSCIPTSLCNLFSFIMQAPPLIETQYRVLD